MPTVNYSKVATDESGSGGSGGESNGPLATPPIMQRPAVWVVILVVVIGAGLMLTSGSHQAVLAEEDAAMPSLEAPQVMEPDPMISPALLRGAASTVVSDTTMLEEALKQNERLREQLTLLKEQQQQQVAQPAVTPQKPAQNVVPDKTFSDLFEDNYRLREQLADRPPAGEAEFDIGAYRAKALAATPPNIIECAEAGEGGSQEACHLPRNRRYEAVGQKGITLWMTGLSGAPVTRCHAPLCVTRTL